MFSSAIWDADTSALSLEASLLLVEETLFSDWGPPSARFYVVETL